MDYENKHNYTHNTIEIDRGAVFSEHEDGSIEASAIASGYKLHSSNWLEEMPEISPSDIFEVRFKNTRRSYYYNVNKLALKKGDIVAVESSPGHDIGIVSLTGDLVARQMKRVGFNPQNGEFKKIYRKAKPYDIEKWQEAIALEHDTMIRSRQYAAQLGLDMKIGDVEYQGDKIKAIFYYIADERVDFRELIKVFAEQFRIRVEMKQIGARQEAGRIGGLGSCGREQCCSSWISSFVSVTTNTARTQEISLNPQKLAGQCGKLKCCLTYEFDSYMDARRELPRVNQPLQILDANYFLVKTDILSHTMWFSTDPHSQAGMKAIPASRVREIQKLNHQGVKPDTLESAEVTSSRKESEEPSFMNAMEQDSITRFDRSRGEGRSRGGRNRGRGRGDRNERGERGERNDNNRRGGRSSQERHERTERQERAPRQNAEQQGSEKQGGEKAERTERSDRPQQERAPRQNNRSRGERGERNGQERGERGERQERASQERGERNGQERNGQERGERNSQERSERPQRRNSRPSQERGEKSQNLNTAGERGERQERTGQERGERPQDTASEKPQSLNTDSAPKGGEGQTEEQGSAPRRNNRSRGGQRNRGPRRPRPNNEGGSSEGGENK